GAWVAANTGGVRDVNEARATKVAALKRALESFTTPVTLIAGGRDKDGDFVSVRPLVMERVRFVVTVGEAAGKIETSWPDVARERAVPLADAGQMARPRQP